MKNENIYELFFILGIKFFSFCLTVAFKGSNCQSVAIKLLGVF